MKVIRNVQDMQLVADLLRKQKKKVGLVPTMGYLHEGHLSLIRQAKEMGNVVVTSLFVNPAQFSPDEDLESYPRDFKRDKALAEKAGTDILFYPTAEEMYPEPFHSKVRVDEITQALCGASRPTHFQGVTTIVAKLFNLVKPHFAIFGQKDAQQVAVIRQMVKDLNFHVEIYSGPIVREEDGLAMSSRNIYLSPDERKDALALIESIEMVKKTIWEGERESDVILDAVRKHIESKRFTDIDYISLVHPDTLRDIDRIEDKALLALAVFVGSTRLIDNLLVEL